MRTFLVVEEYYTGRTKFVWFITMLFSIVRTMGGLAWRRFLDLLVLWFGTVGSIGYYDDPYLCIIIGFGLESRRMQYSSSCCLFLLPVFCVS